jgi:hypothetical protein
MSVGFIPSTQTQPNSESNGSSRFRCNWIASPAIDLPWFIGSAIAGYAIFAMHWALGWDMMLVWLVWFVFIDVPHFFGTYVRTYLDPIERRRRSRLLFGSLLLPLVGPTLILIGYVFYSSDSLREYHQVPFASLIVFVYLWAYWHVMRQHYGMMALYKRKNQDHHTADRWIDASFLYIGLALPFVAFMLRHPQARHILHLNDELSATEELVLQGSYLVLGLVTLIFVGRQLHLWAQQQPLNVPKILLLTAIVPLHVLVGYHPAMLTTTFLAFVACVTVTHDFQYHAFVWHMQQQRLKQAGEDRAAHGLAALICSHLVIYLACAVWLGIVSWGVGCLIGIRPGCNPILESGSIELFGDITLQHLLGGFVLGFIMHHYFVDQFIWRPSKDRSLQKELATS